MEIVGVSFRIFAAFRSERNGATTIFLRPLTKNHAVLALVFRKMTDLPALIFSICGQPNEAVGAPILATYAVVDKKESSGIVFRLDGPKS